MKVLCVFGEHNYGRPERGQSYEYRNFLPALRKLGLEVTFFESWDRSRHPDFCALNRDLLARVEADRPDVVFFVLLGYEIWLETLQLIRKTGVLVMNWGTDDSWKYGQFSRFLAPVLDYYLTTSAAAYRRAKRDGLDNFMLTQWAANGEALAEPLPAARCRYPVSFVGSAYGNRPAWIAALRSRGIEVACFGHGWDQGPVSSEDLARIIRESVISLNFGDSGLHLQGLIPYRNRQIKARVFEVPGAGGFLLTEDAEGLGQVFDPDRELAIFSGIEDLAGKVRRYLGDPAARDAVAWAGYRRVQKEHTYDARFAAIFGLIGAAGRAAARPGAPDWPDFERAVRKHRPGRWARWLRTILVSGCGALWGRARGARAARRILFELSWRLAGARTYSAAGLPGQLFYRES